MSGRIGQQPGSPTPPTPTGGEPRAPAAGSPSSRGGSSRGSGSGGVPAGMPDKPSHLAVTGSTSLPPRQPASVLHRLSPPRQVASPRGPSQTPTAAGPGGGISLDLPELPSLALDLPGFDLAGAVANTTLADMAPENSRAATVQRLMKSSQPVELTAAAMNQDFAAMSDHDLRSTVAALDDYRQLSHELLNGREEKAIGRVPSDNFWMARLVESENALNAEKGESLDLVTIRFSHDQNIDIATTMAAKISDRMAENVDGKMRFILNCATKNDSPLDGHWIHAECKITGPHVSVVVTGSSSDKEEFGTQVGEFFSRALQNHVGEGCSAVSVVNQGIQKNSGCAIYSLANARKQVGYPDEVDAIHRSKIDQLRENTGQQIPVERERFNDARRYKHGNSLNHLNSVAATIPTAPGQASFLQQEVNKRGTTLSDFHQAGRTTFPAAHAFGQRTANLSIHTKRLVFAERACYVAQQAALARGIELPESIHRFDTPPSTKVAERLGQ
jgi:YopJ Serine/Threonine acetyltransferase